MLINFHFLNSQETIDRSIAQTQRLNVRKVNKQSEEKNIIHNDYRIFIYTYITTKSTKNLKTHTNTATSPILCNGNVIM